MCVCVCVCTGLEPRLFFDDLLFKIVERVGLVLEETLSNSVSVKLPMLIWDGTECA